MTQGKATNYTWLGNSSSWADSNSWSPAGIPDSADNITISSGTNNLVLDQNRRVTNLTLSNKTIDLNGFSLTVYGVATMTSGTVTNGDFIARGSLAAFNGTLMDCTVDADCGYIRLSGSTFNEVANFTDQGLATGNGAGGCTFNDDVTITHNGTLTYFNLGGTSGDIFNQNVTFTNNSNRELNIAINSSTNFHGKVILNSTSTGGIMIGSSSGSATLASGKTISIGGAGFAADYLTLRNFTQSGSTAQTLTLTSTAIVNMISCTFNGNLTVSSPGFLLKNSTFNGTSSFTRTGSSGNHQSDGGNTFNAVTVDNAGSSGRIRWATTTPDVYNGNSTFNSSGGQDVQIAYSGDNLFSGDITINSNKVVFNTASGKVTFTGGNSQILNGSYNYSFKKLAINKSANHVTANTTLSVDDTLFFVTGKLITTSTNLLTMKHGSTANGASNSSFVSGPVKKVGNSAFEFPVGKGILKSCLSITAPSNITDAYTAEFINTPQSYGSTFDTTLLSINQCDYWTLARNTGTSNVKVTLHWNLNNCQISYPSNMRVANWNGSKWVDLGNDGYGGSLSNGFVKGLNNPSSYTAFMLSNISTYNNGAPNLHYAKTFALLSGNVILSDSLTIANGKVGSAGYIGNVISTDSSLANGVGSYSVASLSLDTAIMYCNGLDFTPTSNAINGQSFYEGVYSIFGDVSIDSIVNLIGDSTSVFIFNIYGSLQVDSGAVINLNGVHPQNIFWNISNTVTCENNYWFPGIILAKKTISIIDLQNSLQALMSRDSILFNSHGSYIAPNMFRSPNQIDIEYNLSLGGGCTFPTDPCNLVRNSNFDTNSQLPSSFTQINYACPWVHPIPLTSSYIGTADYFHLNSSSPFVGIPFNNWGCENDNSGTGNAYAGLTAHWNAGSDIREYFQQPLQSTLQAGTTYYSEMFVSLADESLNSCNSLGIHFSDIPVSQTFNQPINVIPQIQSPLTSQLATKTGWQLVSGCFPAVGDEAHIVIGNFRDDNNTLTATATMNTCPDPSMQTVVYYYIDDVKTVPFEVEAGVNQTVGCNAFVQLGQSTCITPLNIGQFTYSWTLVSGPTGVGTLSASNIFDPTLTINNTTGSQAVLVYEVTVTSTGGCTDTDEITITSNPYLTVTLTPTNSCSNASGTITSTVSGGLAPFTYLWNTSSTSANLSNVVNGTYTVTVTDNSGCTGTQSVTIISNTLAWDHTPPCIDQNTDFTCTYTGSAGIPSYSWNFGDGNTSTLQNPSHTYTEPGYYEVMLTVNTPTCSDCFRKVIYVSPSCCAVNGTVVYDGPGVVPDVISVNTVWDVPYKLNRTIFVEEGVTLTVDPYVVIEFGPEGKIILDRRDPAVTTGTGARMIMDSFSRLTSITESEPGCPVMWQGVEVWGNSIIKHNSNANRNAHGYLEMQEQSKIENAHNGVLLGKTLFPFGDACNPPIDDIIYPPYDLSFGGGILNADEANSFIRNGIGVRILPFKWQNASEIQGCTFDGGGTLYDIFYDRTNPFFYSGTNIPNRNPWYGEANNKARSVSGIHMWEVNIKPEIQYNDFHDMQDGITSFDARYQSIANSFEDHQYGIDANHILSNSLLAFYVLNENTFKHIEENISVPCTTVLDNAGIRIRAGRANQIWNQNSFGDLSGIGADPQPPSFFGIRLHSCDVTTILDNLFGDLVVGIYTSGSFHTSGRISSITLGNYFYENKRYGIYSGGNNPRMRILCNQWTVPNDDNLCIPYRPWANSGTVPNRQGVPGNDIDDPAGNEWNLDDYTTYNQVDNNGNFFTYHHHSLGTPPTSVIPIPGIVGFNNLDAGVVKVPASCLNPVIAATTAELLMDSVNTVIDTWVALKEETESIMASAPSDSLISYISNSSISSEDLADSLVLYSPLIDEVIDAFLDRPYHITDSIFFIVMKPNLPVPNYMVENLLSRLEYLTDDAYVDSILNLHAFNPDYLTVFAIEREIESNKSLKNEYLGYVIDSLATDSTAYTLLQLLFIQEELPHKMDAVSIALVIDSLDLAKSMFEEMDLVSTEDIYWGQLMEMKFSLKDSGLSLFSMDSTMVALVTAIATSGIECLATRNAQCILKLVYGIDFNDGELDGGRFSNPNSLYINTLELKTRPQNKNIILFPNPANHLIQIVLPSYLDGGDIKILDVNGKMLKFVEVQNASEIISLDLNTLENGIYFLNYNNGKEYHTAKFIVQHGN